VGNHLATENDILKAHFKFKKAVVKLSREHFLAKSKVWLRDMVKKMSSRKFLKAEIFRRRVSPLNFS